MMFVELLLSFLLGIHLIGRKKNSNFLTQILMTNSLVVVATNVSCVSYSSSINILSSPQIEGVHLKQAELRIVLLIVF